MKWGALVAALAAIGPLTGWLRRNPDQASRIWVLVGFLPFATGPFHLYMAVISWAGWPGYVQGAELSLLDLIVFSLYLTLPRSASPLPFRMPMAFYLIAVLMSALWADVPVATLFYAVQLVRMGLLYAVVARACTDERVASALLTGMGAGLFMEAAIAAWERFGLGILQASGSFGHQNLLGLVSHFVTFPVFSLYLAGSSGWLPALVPLAGVLIAVLTTSRGTLGGAAAGYALVFTLSALRRWDSRKTKVALLGTLVVACAVPVAVTSFEKRFGDPALLAGYDERAAFLAAASMILADHPMGVGANTYVVVANTGGYNERAGVAWSSGNSTNVHNVYVLMAAETGYIGLVTFVILLSRPLLVAFMCGWRNRKDPRGDLLIGLGASMLIVYLQSFFEWIFVTFPVQYVFAIAMGMTAGLAQKLGYWSPARRALNSQRPRQVVSQSRDYVIRGPS